MEQNTTYFEYLCDVVYDLIHLRENHNISKDVIIKQILFTGFEVLPLMALISLVLGATIIHQGYFILGSLGQTDWVHKILVSALVRDLAPFIIGSIILARSGTAISTELGNMSVNKEIDALKALGISVISYLVTPRILGMVISQIILAIYFAIIGVLGGFIVSSFDNPITFGDFFGKFIKELSLLDLILMVFKVSLSGLVIATICSYQGLQVSRAFTEVPQRNIKAVGQCVVGLFGVHLIGVMLYLMFQGYL